MRTLYFADSRWHCMPAAPLPLGQHGPRGLKFEDYKLALTDELLEAVLRTGPGGAPANLLSWEIRAGVRCPRHAERAAGQRLRTRQRAGSRFVGFTAADLDGQYWLRSGIAGFGDGAKSRYYLPSDTPTVFGNTTTLEYDEHDLYLAPSTDALEISHRNTVRLSGARAAGDRGRQRQPHGSLPRYAGPRGRRCGEGQVGGTAHGRETILAVSTTSPLSIRIRPTCKPSAPLSTFEERKRANGSGRAGSRFIYHFGEERDGAGDVVWAQRPAMACAIVREIHASQPGGDTSPLQVALECSDGSGTVLMKKIQADLTRTRPDTLRNTTLDRQRSHCAQQQGQAGQAIRADFQRTLRLPDSRQASASRPSSITTPPGRLVRTEMPDGTFSRAEFSPWHQSQLRCQRHGLRKPLVRGAACA